MNYMLIGVVGKPSVGKSTFFKAATMMNVEIANYPFTTIKPNRAVGFVKVNCVDQEFEIQCTPREGYCVNHKRFVPVELIDVAGLVPGAHEGKGKGNQFLDDLNQAHALIHVIDISGSVNENGESVEPLSYDPLYDVEFLENELDMWYLGIIKKGWAKFVRTCKVENLETYKAVSNQLSGLRVTEDIAKTIMKDFSKDLTTWSEAELKRFAHELRTFSKPMLIVANKADIPGASKNVERLKSKYPSSIIIPCSAISELTLKEADKSRFLNYIPGDSSFEVVKELLPDQEKGLEYIKKNILDQFGHTGVQEALNIVVFDLLDYIAVFPGGLGKMIDSNGRTLADCFLLPCGSTALDFAYKLHTDFGENFVKAIDVKKRIPVGKEHLLKNLDVIEIKASK